MSSTLTINEMYLEASLMLSLILAYTFMYWATSKSSSRSAVLTYMVVVCIIIVIAFFTALTMLPQIWEV